MPQGARTTAETTGFKWMLQNVNLLFLGCSVLCLVDISYLSRFWVRCGLIICKHILAPSVLP